MLLPEEGVRVQFAKENVRDVLSRAWNRLVEVAADGPESFSPPDMAELVEQARREWLDAIAYYEEVSDPDLVDHATYMIQAAEKKYIYLLKKAREEGITHSFYS